MDQVPLLPGHSAIMVSGEVHRHEYGVQPPVYAARAGVTLTFPLGFCIGVDAERNPFFSSSLGGTGWVIGVKLEHGVRLPRLGGSGRSGTVFRDANGNGVRDPGETGFAGVIVRNGGTSAVTDADGTFRFPDAGSGAFQVDPRSLPPGWLPPATSRADSARREIGIVAIASAEVHLVVAGDARSRVSTADLLSVIVVARDSAGRAWVARRRAPESATFDALPPGRYHVEVDVSAATEPLHAKTEELPVFEIDGRHGAAPAVTVTLHARTIKVHHFSSGRPQL
jgi:hypothetical protein